MESLGKKIEPEFKIETIIIPNKGEISFCPERGIITSIKFRNKEILYLDEETLQNKESNVKGGVPVLFPNAGPLSDELKIGEGEKFANLKQHGFARDMEWTYQIQDNGFVGTLNSNDETRKIYQYDFELSISGIFEEDGSFTINQSIKNLEADKELPVSSGLHPYFKVKNDEKKNIKFEFPGGDYIKENIEKWSNGKFISIDNPLVPIKVSIPNLGTLTFDISKEYQKVWIWSQTDKNFICIEPVMRDPGGLVSNPEKVKPSETLISNFNIKLD